MSGSPQHQTAARFAKISRMFNRYAEWMFRWETALTTRDENRVVRPLEWGFEWLGAQAEADPEAAMLRLSEQITGESDAFFGYSKPQDYRLEQRHPALFPTNVRPETLARDAELRRRAEAGGLPSAQFLRFTSPVRTPHPENDLVNARWYPAPPDPQTGEPPRKAIVVMPQWNADAFSHNALCSIVNRFGVSALRLSKPYHDIRRPAELERSDYAVSANIGRTIAAARQAVVDIRCCLDWLEAQGYRRFGVLGTSLGSCYGFLAAAHDPRLQVCAFNHASHRFGDVVWTGQSTRHIRAGCEAAGLTQERLAQLWAGISPSAYIDRFAQTSQASGRRTLVVHARYDLTFLERYSLELLDRFRACGIAHESRVLPCGHYTTGEWPFNWLDGWWLGEFCYRAFQAVE